LRLDGGLTKLITENGETSDAPNEKMIATLNQFGNKGWK